MARSTRIRSAVPLGAAAALLIAGGATAALATSTPAATFSKPLMLAGGGAEPSIRVPNDGQSAAYVSAPSGLGSNFWRITEKKNPDGSTAFVQSPVQQPDLGTGGGDSEISVGNHRYAESSPCDAISYSGLHNIDLLDNFTVARSTDCGKTFTLANPYATQNTLTDRQWQTFDGNTTNFLIYHKVDTSQIVVSESPDAGNTYVSLSPDGSHGIIDAATLPSVANSNQVGNIVTDYSHPVGTNNLLSSEPTHTMYAVFGGPGDPADNAQAQVDSTVPGGTSYNHVDSIYLARSDDGGVTWTDTKVYGVPPTTHRELNLLFPVVSVDKAGNVYVLWSDGFKVQYAVSTDHGKTFTKPYQVNHDNRGLTAAGAEKPDPGKSDLFPWLAAGANGMVDVVWYHGQGGAATSNLAYRDPGDAKTGWTVAFAQLGSATRKDAAGAAAPRELTYSEAVTPVIHHGDICQNGTFCSLVPVGGAPYSQGDRSLLDFFEVAIDSAGRANIALADNADAPGALTSAYIRQTSGYSLTTGAPLPTQTVRLPQLQCTSDAAFTDPSGDATQVVVGTPLPNAPALDITKGYVTFDAAKKLLTLHTKVLDLSQDPPTGSTGEQVEFTFTYHGVAYTAVGVHDATQSTDSFHMEAPLRTTVGGPLTGTFDKKSNEVRVNVPAAFFTTLPKRAPALAKGAKLVGLAITTRRTDVLLVPNADEAGSVGCPFIVGGQAAAAANPVTIPARVDNRPPPASAQLPRTGAGLGLPLVGLGLLLAVAALRQGVRRRLA